MPNWIAVTSLLVLSACQSAGAPSPAATDRLDSLEAGQAHLRAELLELRGLVTTAVTRPQGPGATDELMALAARVERVSAVDAGHRNPAHASEDLELLEALADALTTLERQRALHCENVANEGVAGFKRRELSTRAVALEGLDVRIPEPAGTRVHMNQGALELTGHQLDFGIEGPGFFEFQHQSGELRYGRDGSLRLDVRGRLVNSAGEVLTDQVVIPEDSLGVSVSGDGQVFSLGEGNIMSPIGLIRVHTFARPEALRLLPGGSFASTPDSGEARAQLAGIEGASTIRQSYLERSNVDLAREIVNIQVVDRRMASIRRILAGKGVFVP